MPPYSKSTGCSDAEVESKALALLRQKDEEIVKATNRAMELEYFLRKLEMENQAWQSVAKENEAKVIVRIFPCFLAPCFAPCFVPFLVPCFTPCFLAPCWLFFRASI